FADTAHDPEKWSPVSRLREALEAPDAADQSFGGRSQVGQDNAQNTPSGGDLDVLLELCDSQITYRQRYVMIAARAPVIDLVSLDPNNPRSILYQLDRIETHLAALPKSNIEGR